ncbi:MAG: zf-HC2 domain-containing protein [Desulfobacter sp.]|nr:MAG: zf-HC2 domain-containing protein [Desulfobacter sp.]
MISCTAYSEEFISRFVDNEVSSYKRDAFIRHMAGCPDCAAKEAAYRQLSLGVSRHIDAQAQRIQNELPPISVRRTTRPGGRRRSRGFTLKLASLGTAALILAVAVFPWTRTPINEPSAIVNSVDTTGSSVMIIDTPDTRHTIIWFSEI